MTTDVSLTGTHYQKSEDIPPDALSITQEQTLMGADGQSHDWNSA